MLRIIIMHIETVLIYIQMRLYFNLVIGVKKIL